MNGANGRTNPLVQKLADMTLKMDLSVKKGPNWLLRNMKELAQIILTPGLNPVLQTFLVLVGDKLRNFKYFIN